MIQAGGLIKLHYHNNLDLLELFSDNDGILYYNDAPLFQNIQISEIEHNHLVKKPDGLFVDGSFTDRFDYHDNELYFDNIIVSREYQDSDIDTVITSIWSTNPYEQIGKMDLSYWFEPITVNDKTMAYINNSDSTMNVLVSNPNSQSLKITIDADTYYHNSMEIEFSLLPEQQIIVRENDSNELQDITVTLQ